MRREADHATAIMITASISPCAKPRCDYCQLPNNKISRISVDRFAAIVERFIEYKESQGLKDFKITEWLGNAFNFNEYEYTKVAEINRKLDQFYENICLGGVSHKYPEEMRAWLAARQKIGAKNLIVALFGIGTIHDTWNRKKGDFAFQMESQRQAIEIGMGLIQRTFLMHSILPVIGDLFDMFDELGGEVVGRWTCPLYYCGLARKLEHERVTMEILDNQPSRVKATYLAKNNWKSEIDWIEEVRKGNPDWENGYGLGHVVLRLDDSNIDRIESMSCEAILDELIQRTNAAYAVLPSREELCEKYGNRKNEKVYVGMREMDDLWVDRFLRDNPVEFDSYLTHFKR
jgi:hypothetical protein